MRLHSGVAVVSGRLHYRYVWSIFTEYGYKHNFITRTTLLKRWIGALVKFKSNFGKLSKVKLNN